MDQHHESSAAELTRSEIIDHCLNRLRLEAFSLLTSESKSRQIIDDLTTESSAFKSAYSSSEKERRELEQTVEKLRRETDQLRHDMENKLRGSRVICLIDGDGAIFSNDLIADGQSGGHLAAKMLSEATGQYLHANCGINQSQLWVYVFLNKRGLVDAFAKAGLGSLRAKFEDFIVGFNQAAERFLMVDVGSGKEAADAKIKAHLEDNVLLPQTLKILFGGCHDNGYVSTLRSLITAGFHNKLILLRSYSEMAAGIEDLALPSLTVPNLFRLHKLITTPPQGNSVGNPPQPPTEHNNNPVVPGTPPSGALGMDPQWAAKLFKSSSAFRRPSSASITSSFVKPFCPPDDRCPTPELDFVDSSSDTSESGSAISQSSSPPPRMKHVNPNILLSKHKPPPCTLFYLSSCKHGNDCKYAHDYILEPRHYEEMRVNAKKAPCPAVNKGEVCTWGEDCFYGHVCPQKTQCRFFRQGRCKFTGAEMHHEI